MKHIILLKGVILLMLFLGCETTKEVDSTELNYILYEDAENGLSADWHTVSGGQYPHIIKAYNGSDYCVNLPVNWTTSTYNPHEYYLTLNNEEGASILELDVGGTGMEIQHYLLGVRVDTKWGKRTLAWDSFYNHSNIKPSYTEYDSGFVTMVFPSPIELVRGHGYEETTTWSHFKVDIEAYLHRFEPENRLLSVERFIATGGNLDNISLSK